MNGWQLSLVLVAVWIVSGLAGTAMMLRLGYRHPLWFIWGMMLGPLAAPVLAERAEDGVRLLTGPVDGARREGLCILVGVDGSPASRHTVEVARGLFGGRAGRLILTRVVDFDAGDPGATPDDSRLARAQERLNEYAAELGELEPAVEVVAGRPAAALIELAAAEDADVIVVGPPHHRFARVFGSVCSTLINHSPVPVLVALQPRHARAASQ